MLRDVRGIELRDLGQCQLHLTAIVGTLLLLRRIALEIDGFKVRHILGTQFLTKMVDVFDLIIVGLRQHGLRERTQNCESFFKCPTFSIWLT